MPYQFSLLGDSPYEDINQVVNNFNSLREPIDKKHWVKVRAEMLIHTRGVTPPPQFFCCDSESDEEYRVRCQIYKPVSKEVILRGLSIVSRIFQEAGYVINADEEFKKYIYEQRFDGMDLMNYFQQKVLQYTIEDPNGFLVWLPSGEGLKQILSGGVATVPVDVKPVIVDSNRVKYYDKNWFVFSMGADYVICGKNQIFYLKRADTNFQLTPIYNTNFDRLPIIQLGGKLGSCDYYTSFFSTFLEYGDEMLRRFSDYQIAGTRLVYIFEHDDIACNYFEQKNPSNYCNGGRMFIGNDICPKCNGTGSGSPKLTGIMKFKRAKDNNVEGIVNNRSSVDWRSPDVQTYKAIEDSYKYLKGEAERSLHIRQIELAQSGIAKEKDRDDQNAFLNEIASRLYHNIDLSLWFIEHYRNIQNPQPVSISMPTEWKITTEEELRANVQTYIKDTPNSFLAMEFMRELVSKKFAGKDIIEKQFAVLAEWNTIMTSPVELIKVGLAMGTISQKDFYIYQHGDAILQKLIREKSELWFFETEISIILQELDKMLPTFNQNATQTTTQAQA